MTKNKTHILRFSLVILWLLVCQVFYASIQKLIANNIVYSIKNQFRQELEFSNYHYLSRSIIDYSNSNTIRCIYLELVKPDKKILLNLKYKNEDCDTPSFFLDGLKINTNFQALNGDEFEMSFLSNNGNLFYLSLWISRVFGSIIILIFFKILKFKDIKRDLQLQHEKEVSEKILLVTKQVAHDIRSPLSALNIITSTLSDVPEEKRLLIRNSVQRINDIANDLLQKGKSSSLSNSSSLSMSVDKNLDEKENANLDFVKSANVSIENVSQKQNSNFLVATVIDNIISEKRIQFREKINVNINVDLTNSFGLFVNANPNELSRVISNLINNSVEALPNQSGNVDVYVYMAEGTDKRLSTDVNSVCIQIKDNGSGIPKHILEKLGQSGITHGKENTQSGSGLGVYHAMKTIQEFGGKIVFESITAQDLQNNMHSTSSTSQTKTGTTITIELPRSETPSWFADVIKLKPGQEFITVDDDISIHQIWKGRLESLKAKEQNIKITSFTSAKEFREYFNKNLKFKLNEQIQNSNLKLNIDSTEEKQIVFLIDYEFLNQNDNGLKIISDLGIQDKAILVTSRFDEPQIRQDCENQKIKILPKQLAGQIPVLIPIQIPTKNPNDSILNKVVNNMKLSKYDLCLIDDDKLLIHSVWGMMANEKGLNIKMFATPEEFLAESNSIDPHTPLYIDVSLANNVKGSDVAQDIHKLGFDNIHLATGYDADSIQVPSCVRQVVGKEFPL